MQTARRSVPARTFAEKMGRNNATQFTGTATMRSTNSVILAGIAGFIGGIAAGIFYSSEPCRDLRSQLKEGARERMLGVDARVQGLERQLAGVEGSVRNLREESA